MVFFISPLFYVYYVAFLKPDPTPAASSSLSPPNDILHHLSWGKLTEASLNHEREVSEGEASSIDRSSQDLVVEDSIGVTPFLSYPDGGRLQRDKG